MALVVPRLGRPLELGVAIPIRLGAAVSSSAADAFAGTAPPLTTSGPLFCFVVLVGLLVAVESESAGSADVVTAECAAALAVAALFAVGVAVARGAVVVGCAIGCESDFPAEAAGAGWTAGPVGAATFAASVAPADWVV